MDTKKLNALTLIVKEMGLTPQEVTHYWSKTGELSHGHQSSTSPVDIRSKAQLYWYYFENGAFAPTPDAHKNCIGVVGWINDNPNAVDGDKIYIVLPKQRLCAFTSANSPVKAKDVNDGRQNTITIIEFDKKNKMGFPAISYCRDYMDGKAFLLSKEQALILAKNGEGIRRALADIGGRFSGIIWTSTEHIMNYAWAVHTEQGHADTKSQFDKFNTTAILAL